MTAPAPRFSIVIPTRNRAHLLPFALRSALEQDFDDFEIVILANNCRDETRSVVAGMADPRVRYFETGRTLTMPDNWEEAWQKASGEYVIYLSDDDALAINALRTVDAVLADAPDVVTWQDAVYYYADWHDPSTRNVLLLFHFGERPAEDVASREFLDQCAEFTFAWSAPQPKLLNTAAKRSFFEEWRRRLGRLFFPVAPDYSFAWIANHVAPFVRVIHRPLSIRGISDHSIGSNAGLGDAGKEFLREFREDNLLADSPLSVPVSYNLLASTFLRANGALARAGVTPRTVDVQRLVVVAAEQLADGWDRIPNGEDYVSELRAAAQTLGSEVVARLESALQPRAHDAPAAETLRQLRDRTAAMARGNEATLPIRTQEHAGDEACARCALGLNPAFLADANWNYLYVFGEELGVADPLGFARRVEADYGMLVHCRERRRAGGG